MVTESWLSSDEDSQLWLKSQEWNRFGYQVDPVPRQTGQRGGGLLLVFRKEMEFEKLRSLSFQSFESQLWSIKVRSDLLNLLGIYHPPSTSHNQIPDSVFMD